MARSRSGSGWMPAIGPSRTCLRDHRMSAGGGKAGIVVKPKAYSAIPWR
jgi:hypothetical protein